MYDASGDRVRSSYHEAFAAAFGPRSKVFIAIVQLIGLAGVAITFVVLIASAIDDVLPWTLTKIESTAIAVAVCSPFMFFQRLSYVAYLSILGVAVLLVIGVVIPTSAAIKLADGEGAIPTVKTPTLSHFESIGLLIFAFSAHSTFPEHENAMRNPKDFPKVLDLSYSLIAVEKLLFGIVAWIAYGENTNEIVTNNLTSQVIRKIVSACVAINTISTLPLIIVVFFRIAQSFRGDSDVRPCVRVSEQLISLGICGVTAAFLPHFALLMSIFGAMSGTALTFVFPVAMYLKLHYTPCVLRWLYAAIAILGALGGALSLVLSTQRLIEAL